MKKPLQFCLREGFIGIFNRIKNPLRTLSEYLIKPSLNAEERLVVKNINFAKKEILNIVNERREDQKLHPEKKHEDFLEVIL